MKKEYGDFEVIPDDETGHIELIAFDIRNQKTSYVGCLNTKEFSTLKKLLKKKA